MNVVAEDLYILELFITDHSIQNPLIESPSIKTAWGLFLFISLVSFLLCQGFFIVT
jgi:hypothetical protein